MARGPTFPSAFPEVGAVTGGGAQMLQRLWNASGAITIPAKTGWLIARCLGAGGAAYTSANGYFGGGGAFSKTSISLVPTDTLVANGQPGNTSTTTASKTNVTKNGTVICSADSGLASDGNVQGAGGKSANGVGDVKRSGGAPAALTGSNPYYNTPSDHGYLQSVNSNSSTAGCSAGDNGDFDAIGIGANGISFSSESDPVYLTSASYDNGRYGAGSVYFGGSGGTSPGRGLIVLEFWTAKPPGY